MDGGGESTILQLHQWYGDIKWIKIMDQIFRADRILQNNDIGSCSDSCIDASATIVWTQKCFSKTLCTQYKVVKRSYLVIWHWAEWSRATAHGLLFKISPAFVFFLPTQSTHRYIHLSIHKLGKLFHQLLNTLWCQTSQIPSSRRGPPSPSSQPTWCVSRGSSKVILSKQDTPYILRVHQYCKK